MFRFLFDQFKNHFELDRRQAKIHFLLLWVTLFIMCSPVFTYYTYPLFVKEDSIDIRIDTLFATDELLEKSKALEVNFVKKTISAFDEQDWISIGFPRYLAQRILKYQSKGGLLKNEKDLLKIYGLTPELLQKVKPYILTDKSNVITSVKKEQSTIINKKYQVLIDINTVDSLGLVDLPGIGPVFARRIIQYRTLLKGYVTKEQFKEIYGISPYALEVLQERTVIKPKALGLLSTCDYAKLNEHLYISGKDARYILQELKIKPSLCWDDFKKDLSEKAAAHIEELTLYFPCP